MLSELENTGAVLPVLINRMPQRSVKHFASTATQIILGFFDPLPSTVKNVRDIFVLKEYFSGL